MNTVEPNPYAPITSIPPGQTYWVRILICLLAMLLAAVVFLYFAFVALAWCYMLLTLPPTTTANGYFQTAMNVVVWGGVACGAGFGFRKALHSLDLPVRRREVR